MNVGQYLLHRLQEIGVADLFGVPGDFVLAFFNEVLKSKVNYIGTCNELNAAYAADGYARIRGVGAFSSTYTVGELSALNGVAGAFAEKVPVVVITGSPATYHYKNRPLLHHTLGDYYLPNQIYQKVTVAQAHLADPYLAPREIDRVLSACLKKKQPVYLSLPSDIVPMECETPEPFVFPGLEESEEGVLQEALEEASKLLQKAQSPIILADFELIRFGLQKEFATLLEASGFPYATMILGKTVLDEGHPQFIGLYQGDRSREYVKKCVETSDCVLQLGALMSDFNTGGFSALIPQLHTISASINEIRIKNHSYHGITLKDFLIGLCQKLQKRDPATLHIKPASKSCVHNRASTFEVEKEKKITISRFFDRMTHYIQEDAIVIAETGLSLFSTAETFLPKGVTFIAQTFYGSIGYTIGATLGASLAERKRKVYLFVGDGSFQVTCQDVSTMIRYGVKPIIFLLNNDGYTIERVIVDRPYNDIQMWKYHALPSVFGGGKGFDVHTEGELEKALEYAETAESLTLIEIHTDKMDCSPALKKAGESMAKTNQLQ